MKMDVMNLVQLMVYYYLHNGKIINVYVWLKNKQWICLLVKD